MKKWMVGLAVILTLSGCATVTERNSSAEVKVNKGLPVVFIHPLEAETYNHASVGVLPFVLPESMNPTLGRRIAALYQDVLLGKAVFPTVKVLEVPYGDFDEAVAAGRSAGVDLVLVGKVNYALDGTELGGARLDLTVRLINVSSGKTVWNIGQAMDQPVDYPKTDNWHRLTAALVGPPTIKRPEGAPVLTNMLVQAAGDMADVMAGSRYVRR
jgi:uncharacterized protein YceK